MKVKYQEVKLGEVLRYFAEGFQFTDGITLHDYEYFVDQSKGIVVFKLITTGGDKESKHG